MEKRNYAALFWYIATIILLLFMTLDSVYDSGPILIASLLGFTRPLFKISKDFGNDTAFVKKSERFIKTMLDYFVATTLAVPIYCFLALLLQH